MNTITITQVYPAQDKSKDGKPFIDKNGKPFKKISFKTAEYGDRWVSAFAFRETDSILGVKVGDILDDYVKENGQYLNYSKPTQFELIWKQINDQEKRIKALEDKSEQKERHDFSGNPELGNRVKGYFSNDDIKFKNDEPPVVEDEGIDLEDIPI
jgi:hypothetical protein